VYWGARLILQFTWIDRSQAPRGTAFVAAEVALVALFVALVATYGTAFASHFRAGPG
jgi:hypothetical protein